MILTALCCTIEARGQRSEETEQIQAQIIDLKLSGLYFYAEATSTESREAALQAALRTLCGAQPAVGQMASEAVGRIAYPFLSAHRAFVYVGKQAVAIPPVEPTAQPAVQPPLLNLDDFDIPEEELEKPLQQDVSTLLTLDTYESVMLFLEAMQDDGRLVYGRIATLTSPEQAYLIIIKDGRLVTVLDRGKGERMNLKSHVMEPVKNYRGHAIIWMKTFK